MMQKVLPIFLKKITKKKEMSSIKCEICEVSIPKEKCVFAIHKKTVNGKEHVFCCAHYGDEFEKKHPKAED